VEVTYPVPDGWSVEPLQPAEGFSVLEQNGGTVSIVPLDLDTLVLPPMLAWSGSDTLALSAPVLVVDRTIPDTLYVVSPFPAPAGFSIPPGLPEDYLYALRYWLKWRGAPRPFPLLPVAAAALLLSAAAFLVARARRRKPAAPDSTPVQAGSDPSRAALALLESREFVTGDWRGLFREMDLLLRQCVASRFASDPTALTWRQITSRIARAEGSKEFGEDCSGLIDEIRLQRYAGWGSSRERAEAWVRRLAQILGRWWR
jgi:hypothetical protein